uniref:JNK-interacting protein 1 n=1 Tax=Ditylenchus dipsaci TaxID=166011 RepID=A0A915DHV7_9BILA
MEDSYYEDGLNGNTPLEDRDLLLNANRQINEVNRKNSGYNLAEENSSGISSCCTSSSTNADNPTNRGVAGIVTVTAKHSNGPTHRVQFPFSPRHPEEIALEVGDAVKVERECEDHWCYGTNLRTTHHGIFPAAHVCEIDLVEEICQGIFQANVQVPLKQDRDTFYLTMLASVEVGHHKGNDVLVQAINKICSVYQQKDEILIPQTILMEVSFRGIHVIDKRRKDFFRCPTFDFFFSLQNISFCGAHPKQLRYFGFITKHPLLPRFACHVFLSQESTQPIVEAIGRAFKRSYDEYMAFAHPTEDIFIE